MDLHSKRRFLALSQGVTPDPFAEAKAQIPGLHSISSILQHGRVGRIERKRYTNYCSL